MPYTGEQEERYYLQYNPINCAWELWECVAGEHDVKASFFDGDRTSSPLAEIVLSFLNAIAEVGETLGKQYIPLTQEEIDARVDEHMEKLRQGMEQR